jgi:hypothetical protein
MTIPSDFRDHSSLGLRGSNMRIGGTGGPVAGKVSEDRPARSMDREAPG